MALRKLTTVLGDFRRNLRANKRLAADAYRLSLSGAKGKSPLFSAHRRDSMTELAFFRAFLAWEAFLEEAFILYMLGQKAPKGPHPVRYAFPPTLEAANYWAAEGQRYAKWTNAAAVSTKAERFFRDGRPFSQVLRGSQNMLEEICTIRNAIAHASTSAQEKFENLVRNKLGILPADLTVGSFLGTSVAGVAPPVSYFDTYTAKIAFAAEQIVST